MRACVCVSVWEILHDLQGPPVHGHKDPLKNTYEANEVIHYEQYMNSIWTVYEQYMNSIWTVYEQYMNSMNQYEV